MRLIVAKCLIPIDLVVVVVVVVAFYFVFLVAFHQLVFGEHTPQKSFHIDDGWNGILGSRKRIHCETMRIEIRALLCPPASIYFIHIKYAQA